MSRESRTGQMLGMSSRATRGSRGSLVAALVGMTLPIFTAMAQTHVVILTGLGGEERLSKQFTSLGATLAGAMHSRFSIPDSAIVLLGEDTVGVKPWYRGQATKVNVEAALAKIADHAPPNAQVVLVLIGNGSGEGSESRFSMPGPDLTATDFSRMLDRFSKQRVAFVNLTMSSGDMLPIVAGPNRVVITATKTAFERNESKFGGFFVEAFAKDVADSDKDGRVSLLEAFLYASAETRRHYEDATKLMTEHAQLDDDGDGKGEGTLSGRTSDGLLARRFFVDASAVAARAAALDPQLTRLYGERFATEDQIDSLKRKKAEMKPDEYDAALEKLLLSLARTAREIRKLEGRE